MIRVACLSDVHGNAVALRHALRHAKDADATRFLFVGDIVSKGPQPAETIDIVRGLDVPVVRGNNERRVLAALAGRPADKVAAWTAERLDGAQRDWLRQLPAEWSGTIGGHVIRMVHGSDRSDEDPVYPSVTASALAAKVGAAPCDIFLCGHSHLPFVRRFDRRLVANAGSVGMPYDGDPRGSYVLLDLERDAAPRGRVVRFEYPVEEVVREVVARGPPGAMVEGYRSGLRPVRPKEDPGPTAGRVAAAHLRMQRDALQRSAAGLETDDDPERVHDLRVACRRARTTFRTFRDLWTHPDRASVDTLKWALGQAAPVRDLDVLVERFQKYAGKAGLDPSQTAEVVALLLRRRAPAKAALVDAVRSDRFDALLRGLDDAATNAEAAAEIRPARLLAVTRVAKAAKKVDKVWPADPHDAPEERLHELRIAFKHLRYTLEAFAPAYGSGLWPEIRSMKRLQDALGALQDAAIAHEALAGLPVAVDDAGLRAALEMLLRFEEGQRNKARKKVVRRLDEATGVPRAAAWAVA